MNPIYDTVLGKPVNPEIYKYFSTKKVTPMLNLANFSDAPNAFEIENMAYNNGIYRRDSDLTSKGFYGDDEEYDTFDSLEDNNGVPGFFSKNSKKLTRSLGHLISRNQEHKDQDGNVISVPYATTIDPFTGKENKTPTAVELNQLGSTGDVLDNMTANKNVTSATINGMPVNRFEVNSYFYPIYDPKYGWIYQEVVGTGENIKKLQLAGESIVSQYGPKTISDNPISAFGSQIVSTASDLPRTLHSFGAAGGDIGESIANLITGDGFNADYGRSNAYADYWKYLNESHDYLNKRSLRGDAESIFDNKEAFGAGLGSGLGSLIQYAGLGRLLGAGSQAAGLLGTRATMFTAGTVINFGEAYDEAKNAGLPLEDAALLGMATGMFNSAIETSFGANIFDKWLVGGAGARKTAQIITEEVGGDVSKLASKTIQNNIMSKISVAVNAFTKSPVIGQMAEEGTEEILQGFTKQSLQSMYDAFFADSEIEGSGYFGTNPFSWESVRQNLEEGTIGAILGGAGSVQALRKDKSARKEPLISFVARNEENSLHDGASQALNSGAINQDQYDNIIKDIDGLVTIRNSNMDLFGKISNYKPEYRGKIAENILNKLNTIDSWIEENKNMSLLTNDNTNLKKDYVNNLEDLIQDSVLTTVNLGEDSSVNIPISTIDPLIAKLKESGKKQEALIVEQLVKDSKTKTSRLVRNSNNIFNNIDKDLQRESKYRFITDTNNSLLSLGITNAINNERTRSLLDDINNITSNSNILLPGGLSDISFRLQDSLPESQKEFKNNISRVYKESGIDGVNKEVEKIFKIHDDVLNENKNVFGINEFMEKHKMIYSINAGTIMNEVDIDNITDKKYNESEIKEYEKLIKKESDLEKSGNIDIIENKKRDTESNNLNNRTELSALNNFVDISISAELGKTTFSYDDVIGKLNIDNPESGKYPYSITSSSNTTINESGIIESNNKEGAVDQYKSILKNALNKKITKSISTNINIDLADSRVQSEISDSPDTINNSDAYVTSNVQLSKSSNIDTYNESKRLYSFINNPMSDMNGFGNNGSFSISDNFTEIKNDSDKRGKAVKEFLSLNNEGDFNKLSSIQRDNIIDYLPIRYVFKKSDNDSKPYSIYLSDKSSYNKEITHVKRNTRLYIIQQLLQNNKIFKPEVLNINRGSGKYNISYNKFATERNSNIDSIKALNIIKDGNNYKYNFGNNKEVRIGISDNNGAVLFNENNKNLSIATGIGNSGNVYLILPSELSNDSVPNRILKLNPTKVSSEISTGIFSILVDIASGKISEETRIEKDNVHNIVISESSKLTYGEFIELITPYGGNTIMYKKDDGTTDKPFLFNKTLYVDQISGLIRYGNDESTNEALAIDSSNYSDVDVESFVSWMTDNKNYSVSMEYLNYSNLPEFSFYNISSISNENYDSFLIRNGIVKSDINKNADSIIKDTVLYINFPNVIVSDPTIVSKKEKPGILNTNSDNKNIIKEKPISEIKDVPRLGFDLSNNILKGSNNINEKNDNGRVHEFVNNLDSESKAYAIVGISMSNFVGMTKQEKLNSFIDITDKLPIIKRIASQQKLENLVDLYDDIKTVLLANMKMKPDTQLPIISFSKNNVFGNTEESDITNDITNETIDPLKISDAQSDILETVSNEESKSTIELDFIRSANDIDESIEIISDNDRKEIEEFFKNFDSNSSDSDMSHLERSIIIDNISDDYEYSKMNESSEKIVYRSMLSSITGGNIESQNKIIEVLKSSGNVKYAWASMNVDGVTLWTGAESGTLYHEAFHRVSQLYLNNRERSSLYKDARIEFNMPDSSDFEIEEILAEDFRNFVLNSKSKKPNIFVSIWQNIVNFITQFVFNRKPSYSNLQSLYKSIHDGGYKYYRSNKKNIELFLKRYPNSDIGLEIDGNKLLGFENTKQFYEVVKTLTAITLNSNGIESMATSSSKMLSFNDANNYIISIAKQSNIDFTKWKNSEDYKNSSDVKRIAIESRLYSRLNLYKDILVNFNNIFVPAIYSRLNSLGWRSSQLLEDMSDIENENIFNNIKNDEIASSYEFSAKDTASADIKMLFETLLISDRKDQYTGLPKYASYDIAWFEMFRRLHDSSSISEMLSKIKSVSDEIGGVNMYSSLYDKLTNNSVLETLRTRFWVTLKKHRHNFVNTYFRKEGSEYSYFINDSDINKRSRQLASYWSSMFGITGKHKTNESNIKLIESVVSDFSDLQIKAKKNKLDSFEMASNSLIDIFGRVNIDIDHNTIKLLINDYVTNLLNESGEIDKFRNFILDVDINHKNGFSNGFRSFFNNFLSFSNNGVIGKDERINPITKRKETPEDYLLSNKFIKVFAEKYILTNPSIEDDSVLGPDGNNVYAYSEYNHLTQSIEEYFKDSEYINKLSSVSYNKGSLWLNHLTSESFNKDSIRALTSLSFLQIDENDTGRDYTNISDVEDTMLKFNAIMSGKYPIPTLANKRTYYFIDGIPTHSVNLIIDQSTNNIKLDDKTIDVFTDYLKSEYLAIKQANKKRSDFLKRNNITINDFNNLSEKEQDAFDYSMLVLNYHYSKGKDGRVNLEKGNGYKFRYFTSYNVHSLATLSEIFKNSNTSTLRNDVRKSLNDNINDTILNLSDLGIITMDRNISASEKSIGTSSSGVIVINDNVLLDKKSISKNVKNNTTRGIDNLDSSNSKKFAMLNMISNYAINTAISTIEFEKLISFDLAYYKDIDDRVKRYSALASTGLSLRTDWSDIVVPSTLYDTNLNNITEYGIRPEELKRFNTVSLKSNIITNSKTYQSLYEKYVGDKDKANGELFKLYKSFWISANSSKTPTKYKRFFEKTLDEVYNIAISDAQKRLSGYKNIDQTDAQVLISPEMFRKIGIMIGEWSDEKERAFQLLESDKELSTEETLQAYQDVTFNVLKMVYFGPSFEDDLAIPIYDKMSLATVFKRMVKNTDLELIYDNMKSNDIQMLAFDSAVKSGGRQAIRFYEKEDQSLPSVDYINSMFSDPKYKHVQEFKYLRRQLVTDPHEAGEIALGTQSSKIGMSGVEDHFIYKMNDGTFDGKEIKEINKIAIDELTRRGFEKFKKRLNIDTHNNIDKSSFMKMLRDNAEMSNQSDNLINALNTDFNGEYVIEPSLLPTMSWVQSRILSLIKKDVIDINLPGNAYIQMSNFGFKNSNIKIEHNDIPGFYKNGDLSFKNENNELEIMVSMSIIKPFLPKIKIGVDVDQTVLYRDMTIDEINVYVNNSDITSMGYRIPTQGQNSIVPVKIVKILPDTMGDTIVLPSEFTTLSGSDFDVDKLYIVGYNYSYDIENKKLNKISYNTDNILNNISSFKTEQVQNLLIDTYMSVLTSDNHLLETTTPLDATTAPIKEVVSLLDEILGNTNSYKNLETSFPKYQSGIKSQNVGADAGIGPTALANVHHQITTIAKTSMNTDVIIDKNKRNISSDYGIGRLDKKYDDDGVLILDWTSALINAHVDAAKDPYILKLNVNKYTYSTTTLLIRSGFGVKTFLYLPQPILIELANKYNRINSGKLGLTDQEIRKIKWKDSVINEWIEQYKMLSEKEGYVPKYDMHSKEVVSNLTDKDFLLNLLKTPKEKATASWYFYQLAIASHYEQLEKYGNSLSLLVSVSQIDTAKYGNNATSILIFQNTVAELLLNNEYFNNAEDVYSKTFLGEKKKHSIDMFFDIFGSEFIELSPVFQNIVASILKETGNYSYSNEKLINTISNEVKHFITAPFFEKYIEENNINIRDMFFSKNSTVEKYNAIIKLSNSNYKFKDLESNDFLKMLKPNSSDLETSKKLNKPQLFNANIMKNRDSDSINIYVSGFNDILTHKNEAVRRFGEELILYAYLTSGGTSGGINNFMSLVPYKILSNLSHKDGTTYNDYIKKCKEILGEFGNLKTQDYKRLVYKSLWYNTKIVPSIGTAYNFDDNFVMVSQNRWISDAQGSISSKDKTKRAKVSPYLLMSPYFTKIYYTGKDSIGFPQFIPFFTITNTDNKSESYLYEYEGCVYDKNGTILNPVYKISNKLSYKDKQYTIKDLSEKSIIDDNNKYSDDGFKLNNNLFKKEVPDGRFITANKFANLNYNDKIREHNDSIEVYPDIDRSQSEDDTEENMSINSISRIIDGVQSIIIEYSSNTSSIENSIEFELSKSLSSNLGLEPISASGIVSEIEESKSNVVSSLMITPVNDTSIPIAVIRNSSYLLNETSSSLRSTLDRLHSWGFSFRTLSSDELLNRYLSDNNMIFNSINDVVSIDSIVSIKNDMVSTINSSPMEYSLKKKVLDLVEKSSTMEEISYIVNKYIC